MNFKVSNTFIAWGLSEDKSKKQECTHLLEHQKACVVSLLLYVA